MTDPIDTQPIPIQPQAEPITFAQLRAKLHIVSVRVIDRDTTLETMDGHTYRVDILRQDEEGKVYANVHTDDGLLRVLMDTNSPRPSSQSRG